MGRLGPLLVLALAALVVLMRHDAHTSAEQLLAHETTARQLLATLYAASVEELATGGPHPGLAALLHHVPSLRPLSDLDHADVSYARDDAYMYGLAVVEHQQEDRAPRSGFVLRAWPREYGVTGDLEYLISDAGTLWEGQNHVGRSGTARGFPPDFPVQPVEQNRRPWWTTELPAPLPQR